jgi:hypothetical protein
LLQLPRWYRTQALMADPETAHGGLLTGMPMADPETAHGRLP